MSRVWFLVPARGGSKGIPRKNVRLLDAKPLITHVLSTLNQIAPKDRIVVSTDDPEIVLLSQNWAIVHDRSATTAGDTATLDEVACEVARWIMEKGGDGQEVLITVQPTSPFIRAASIDRAAKMLDSDGTESVVSVKDDRHLRWTIDDDGPKPLFSERVNRQWMDPVYSETGGVVAVRLAPLLKNGTRFIPPVSLLELAGPEALDIDDYMDWAIAEHLADRRRIVIRADAAPGLGMGHVFRATALAMEWSSHDVTIATVDAPGGLGVRFLEDQPFESLRFEDESVFQNWLKKEQPDLVVFDILDTTEEQVETVQQSSGCVVCFEDLGPGARLADLVINDLYPTSKIEDERQLAGISHTVLAPAFETVPPREACPEKVRRVLVTFGGTDPSGLTTLAVKALLDLPVKVDVVLGPGYSGEEIETDGMDATVHRSVDNMALLMREADLAITSAGRTVTEVLSMGVVPIVLCQNRKELTHTHASGVYGVLNLGLGSAVDQEGLQQHVRLLMEDEHLRRTLWERGRDSVKSRSNAEVCRRILEVERSCRRSR